MELRRPRQWGGCWLACELYHQLELDQFFSQRLPANRKGTRWDMILQTLVGYRLLDPGSEWRLHREWFLRSALADLLASDFSLAESHKLYRVHDLLLPHKAELFSHLQQRWKDLFGARFEVLLYDLTSTYFESDPAFEPEDKRKFGYSRDKRNDCVQVINSPCGYARRLPHRLRSSGGQYCGQNHLGKIPPKNRSTIRQGRSDLGDGSRSSHRRSAGPNARE